MGMVIKHTRNTFFLLLAVWLIALGCSYYSHSKRVELYRSGLDPQELPHLRDTLHELGFEHSYNERFDGILVAPEDVVAARVALARSGLPRKTGFAWDVDDPDRYFEQHRLSTAESEIEECLSHYPELAEYRVELRLSCQYFIACEDHVCEQAYILALEKPGQKLSEQQVQGLLSLLALSEPKLRRVEVVRGFGESEPERTTWDLDSRP